MEKTYTSYYFITDSNQGFYDKVNNISLEKILNNLPSSYKGHIISKEYIKILFDHSLVYECDDLKSLKERLIKSIHKELKKTA